MKKSVQEVVLAAEEDQEPVLGFRPTTVREFRSVPAVEESRRAQHLFLAGAALRAFAQTGVAIATKGTYRLMANPRFGPELLAKGPHGTLRGFYREGGKIAGHAKFKPVNAVSLANVGLALLEIATVVTSTVHLQDIATQLKEVKALLRKLHDLLEDQRVGRLKGNLEYLYEIWTMLEQGTCTPRDGERYLPQLELIYRECLGEIHTAQQQMGRRKQELGKAQKVRLKGHLVWKKINEKDVEQLREAVMDFSLSLHIALLAQETASVACALGVRLGVPAPQIQHRLHGLGEHVQNLKQDWNGYADDLRTKFEDVATKPGTQKIQKELAGFVAHHQERPKVLLQRIESVRNQLSPQRPIELFFRVEEGQVVDVRQIQELPT
ncbi:hypothetical protein [Deinococcus hopiensis]|uniref:Uncharacterized protein n=1 Tax=Deinococcus hopiensis KR-140 TaxID=695939 RepID=A0A1W1UM10_9DEIO|nr:hypothetical protein [Deinococcus hopiensis]SMB82122.1 hypothetical protein SAMN00790413_04852 [Deinococcus hopiensis KR-140]